MLLSVLRSLKNVLLESLMSGNLPDRLKKYLQEEGISVREFERKAGLPVSAVQNIINGRSQSPKLRTIKPIADILGCEVEELISQSKIVKKKVDTIKNAPWDFHLYANCVNEVNEIFSDLKMNPRSKVAIEKISEVYFYSVEAQETEVNKRFARWLIKKNY